MNPPSNVAPESPPEPRPSVPAASARTLPFYWSLRRELWEHRFLYLAPLVVAAVVLIGFAVNVIHSAGRAGTPLALHIPNDPTPIEQPYAIAAVLLILTGLLTGGFYCLDALYGERRDRSILFWRSLPVSDLTTVLSKASVALIVLPLVIFAIIVATHLAMLLLHTVVLLASGAGLAALRIHTPLAELWVALLYGLAALALWHAPICGWLLLVSAWARRAVFLWASLPLLAICITEKVAFNTSQFAFFLGYRFWGGLARAFGTARPCCVPHPLGTLTPGNLLSTPGLWIGLAVAAIFLAAAARIRRYRGPI
ncbi:MAG: ABC transporter permease [Bryobacteraceae bacterium]